MRGFKCRLCVWLWSSSPTSLFPVSIPPSPTLLSSPFLSSSLTLLLIREESFHYLLRLGCQSLRPWPKFVVLPRHIGEMISGVISPPLHEAFIPPRGPPYLQARSGSLTGRLLAPLHSPPLLHLLILHHVLHLSKCLCSLLSQIHFNTSLSLLLLISKTIQMLVMSMNLFDFLILDFNMKNKFGKMMTLPGSVHTICPTFPPACCTDSKYSKLNISASNCSLYLPYMLKHHDPI